MVPDLRSQHGQALLALAQPEGPSDIQSAIAPLDGASRSRFLAEIAANRLEGALVSALEQAGMRVDSRLSDVVDDNRRTRLLVSSVLNLAATALDEAGIDWVTVKGPTVAAMMSRPELRTYNDLDLLVAADRLEESIEVLASFGGEEINQNWLPYLRFGVGEVPLSARRISVDLHWHLVGLAHTRRHIHLPPAPMLARRRRITAGGIELAVLDAEDQLLHLAMHCALSGATRLDQLRDIAVVVAADPVDWDVFVSRATEAGIGRLVAQALDRARVVLGAAVPKDKVETMGGFSVALRRRLDGAGPRQLKGLAVTPWRDSPGGLVSAASFQIGERVAALVGRHRGWDFTDQEGRLYYLTESGGPSARTEFLRYAATWRP